MNAVYIRVLVGIQFINIVMTGPNYDCGWINIAGSQSGITGCGFYIKAAIVE